MTQLDNLIHSDRWNKIIEILIDEGLLEQLKSSHSELEKQGLLKKNSPNRLILQLEEWACQAYSRSKKHNLAMPHCEIALQINSESIPSLLAKADSLLASESYDEAIRLLNKANEVTGGQNQQILQQLDKAQRLLRQSKKNDYYKILGVSRDADSKAIKKAYRNLSKQYHPDKYRGDLDPDSVSRKMAEINSAYEILSDEGLYSL
jgi:DnaJ homolog subfamily C member 3